MKTVWYHSRLTIFMWIVMQKNNNICDIYQSAPSVVNIRINSTFLPCSMHDPEIRTHFRMFSIYIEFAAYRSSNNSIRCLLVSERAEVTNSAIPFKGIGMTTEALRNNHLMTCLKIAWRRQHMRVRMRRRNWKQFCSCLLLPVLCFQMAPHVDLPLERPATPGTAEGFEARVFPAVSDQVRALAEGFAAVTAFIRLLA